MGNLILYNFCLKHFSIQLVFFTSIQSQSKPSFPFQYMANVWRPIATLLVEKTCTHKVFCWKLNSLLILFKPFFYLSSQFMSKRKLKKFVPQRHVKSGFMFAAPSLGTISTLPCFQHKCEHGCLYLSSLWYCSYKSSEQS